MLHTLKQKSHESFVWFKNQWISVKKLASDGCTGVPDLGLTHCCQQHDADYRQGSGVSRWQADWKLGECIFKKGHLQSSLGKQLFYYALTPVFFIGVRVFGWRFYQKVKNNG